MLNEGCFYDDYENQGLLYVKLLVQMIFLNNLIVSLDLGVLVLVKN